MTGRGRRSRRWQAGGDNRQEGSWVDAKTLGGPGQWTGGQLAGRACKQEGFGCADRRATDWPGLPLWNTVWVRLLRGRTVGWANLRTGGLRVCWRRGGQLIGRACRRENTGWVGMVRGGTVGWARERIEGLQACWPTGEQLTDGACRWETLCGPGWRMGGSLVGLASGGPGIGCVGWGEGKTAGASGHLT